MSASAPGNLGTDLPIGTRGDINTDVVIAHARPGGRIANHRGVSNFTL
jgi:hypothetical protein